MMSKTVNIININNLFVIADYQLWFKIMRNYMSNRMLYKILIFDDDPLSLHTEERDIYDIVGNSKDYDIYVEKSTSSRDVLDLAEDNLFDVFILDVCSRKGEGKFAYDYFDYQGQDLYDNLLDKHPKLKYNAKFIIVSNLNIKETKRIFDNRDAVYLCKQETNFVNLAHYLKAYLDEKYKSEYKSFKNMEKNNYNININGNSNKLQINISNDNSQQNIHSNMDIEKLNELIDRIYSSSNYFTINELQKLDENLNLLRDELSKQKPLKSFLDRITTSLLAIKGTAEFGAAIVALIEFINQI